METDGLLPNKDVVSKIHDTAVAILEAIGIRTDHEGMKELLSAAGCRIRSGRVFIPATVVEKALREVPSGFTIYGRGMEKRVTVGQDATIGTNTGIFAWIHDFETGEIRRCSREDVAASTRLLDAMENVHAVYVSLVDATEVEPHLVTVTDFAEVLANTTKPLIGPGVTNKREAQAVVDLAAATLGGDRKKLAECPTCVPFICPVTPLFFPKDIVDALLVIAEAGLPLDTLTNPVMGLTAPLTVAGAVAQGHAEMLALIVMAYCVRPGLPILFQNTPSVADLRSLSSTTGGVETGMIRQVGVALARYLDIPSIAHGHTSSAVLDFQAGQEKALNNLLIASARPSVLGGLGSLGNCTVTSYESILIDDERYAMIFRAMQGASVEGDRLDLGVFEEIARSGNALWSAQTMKYMRSDEIVNYRFAVREGLVNGGLVEDSLVERARKKTRKLLETYEVEPLDEEIASHINQIICEYDHQFINRSSSTEDL